MQGTPKDGATVSLTTEERQKLRADIEACIYVTLKAMTDDADAIIALIEANDIPLTAIAQDLEHVCAAADTLHHMRYLSESEMRTDAIEAAEKVSQDLRARCETPPRQ